MVFVQPKKIPESASRPANMPIAHPFQSGAEFVVFDCSVIAVTP
jgi:hypothetical protein